MVYIFSVILFNLKKDRNPALCKNTDEPRGHYTKWNKLGSERQITTWIQTVKLIEAKNRMVIARGWGVREQGGGVQRVQRFNYTR